MIIELNTLKTSTIYVSEVHIDEMEGIVSVRLGGLEEATLVFTSSESILLALQIMTGCVSPEEAFSHLNAGGRDDENIELLCALFSESEGSTQKKRWINEAIELKLWVLWSFKLTPSVPAQDQAIQNKIFKVIESIAAEDIYGSLMDAIERIKIKRIKAKNMDEKLSDTNVDLYFGFWKFLKIFKKLLDEIPGFRTFFYEGIGSEHVDLTEASKNFFKPYCVSYVKKMQTDIVLAKKIDPPYIDNLKNKFESFVADSTPTLILEIVNLIATGNFHDEDNIAFLLMKNQVSPDLIKPLLEIHAIYSMLENVDREMQEEETENRLQGRNEEEEDEQKKASYTELLQTLKVLVSEAQTIIPKQKGKEKADLSTGSSNSELIAIEAPLPVLKASQLYCFPTWGEQESIRLMHAAQTGDLATFVELLTRALALPFEDDDEHFIKNIVDRECEGNILHWAAHYNHTDIIECILQTPLRSLIYSRSKNDSTPLHNAVSMGHVEAARLLIEAGASKTALNKNKQTPLNLADSLVDSGVAQLFKKKEVRESTKDVSSHAPFKKLKSNPLSADTQKLLDRILIDAVNSGSLKGVKYLLEQGANPEGTVHDDITALGCAINKKNKEIINLLIGNSSSSPNTQEHINAIEESPVSIKRTQLINTFNNLNEKVDHDLNTLGTLKNPSRFAIQLKETLENSRNEIAEALNELNGSKENLSIHKKYKGVLKRLAREFSDEVNHIERDGWNIPSAERILCLKILNKLSKLANPLTEHHVLKETLIRNQLDIVLSTIKSSISSKKITCFICHAEGVSVYDHLVKTLKEDLVKAGIKVKLNQIGETFCPDKIAKANYSIVMRSKLLVKDYETPRALIPFQLDYIHGKERQSPGHLLMISLESTSSITPFMGREADVSLQDDDQPYHDVLLNLLSRLFVHEKELIQVLHAEFTDTLQTALSNAKLEIARDQASARALIMQSPRQSIYGSSSHSAAGPSNPTPRVSYFNS